MPRPRPPVLRAAFALASIVTIVTSPTSFASAAPRVIAAAGDISPASERDDDDQVANMIRSVIAPDALLVLGDLQYETGTREEFRRYYAKGWGVAKLADITYPVPGNHEYEVGEGESEEDPAAGYFRYFRRHAAVNPNGVSRRAGFYSFNLGQWHIVALNSRHGGVPARRQVRWLDRDLARSDARCELAFWHHPRWSSGSEHGDSTNMQPFWSTAVKDGVDVVLNSHDHAYERFGRMRAHGGHVADEHRGPGARTFVVGTGGKGGNDGFGSPMNGSEFRWPDTGQAAVFGALRLRLADRSYSWTMLGVGGTVIDAGGPVSCR